MTAVLTFKDLQPTVPVATRQRPGLDPFQDNRVTFDADGDAYQLAKLDGRHYLAHSRGSRWEYYPLPESQWARIEFNDRPGRPQNPPPVLLYGDDGYLEIVMPEKYDDGSLFLTDYATAVTTDSLLVPNHSGGASSVISHDGFVFVPWPSRRLPKGKIGTDQFISIIHRESARLIRTEFLGTSSTNTFNKSKGVYEPDPHDIVAMTVDSRGVIHILLGAHHGELLYCHSTGSGWDGFTEPVPVGLPRNPENNGGHTYVALVCDAQDRLHVVTRYTGDRYHPQLVYIRRNADGTWTDSRVLVHGLRGQYAGYYHQLNLDGDQLILTSAGVLWGGLTAKEIEIYNRLWPGELPEGVKPYPESKTVWYPTQKRHDPFELFSDDGGDTWEVLA